jgi:glycosyltransferase involved in cell wall biosynthesis
VHLDLVGGRGDRAALERVVARLGLTDRVRFHGAMTEDAVARMLERADLFVLPSLIEGVPVSAMEALACGLCVVATRVTGVPELIRDGETGLLAEPGDPLSLREALERALDGSGGVDAAAGRRLIETEFAIDTSAQRLIDLFMRSAAGPTRA